MKNDISKNSINGGIRVVNKMEIVMPLTRGIVGRICLMITALLGVVGALMSFFTMYDIGVSHGTLLFYCIVFYLLFAVILNLPGNFRLAILPVLAIYAFLLYKNWRKFSEGFKIVFNAVYSQAYKYSGDFYTVKDKSIDNAELFAAFMICLFACLICIAVCDKAGFFFGFLFTYPIVEIGLYFGRSPSLIYGFMVFISWVMLLVLSGCGRYQKGGGLGFMRRGRDFTAQPGVRFHTAGMCSLIAFVLSVLIFLMTFLVSSAVGYKRPESVDELRRNIKIAASEFSFDDLGESLERLGASMGLNDDYKLYSNKLGRMGTVDFKNTTELTMDISDIPDDNIYLKGYTGTFYTGHEWTGITDDDIGDHEYMFERFDEDDMHPQLMLADYLRLRYPDDMDIITADIKSKYRNEKYSYIPYGGIPQGKITYDKDGDMWTESKRDYTVQFPKMTITEENIRDILSGADYSINTYFSEYGEFVREQYLSIPDTQEMLDIYDKYVKDSILSENGVDSYRCLEYIKELLEKETDYSLTPGATPEKEDFVSYFLNESHKGYCVHFATAGVVLARMAGIPARYAEGYIATRSDMENGAKQPDGGYSVSIRDSRGHAWAEIYYDGLGWIPFEFTPSSAAAFDDSRHSENGGSSTSAVAVSSSRTTQTSLSSDEGGEGTTLTSDDAKNTAAVTGKGTEPQKKHEKKPEMSIKGKLIVMVTIAILAALAYLAVRHILIRKRREKIFGGSDSGAKINEAYTSVYGILGYVGASQGNMQYMDFAKKVCDEHPDILRDDEFVRLTALFLKAQVGDIPPQSDEGAWAADTYMKIYGRLCKNAGPIKKLIIRFIKNL